MWRSDVDCANAQLDEMLSEEDKHEIERLALSSCDVVTSSHRHILKIKWLMNNVEINKSMHLSEHFSLGEVCKMVRYAWNGLNFSAPFIVMRHWDKMHQEGNYWCVFATSRRRWSRSADCLRSLQWKIWWSASVCRIVQQPPVSADSQKTIW